MTIMTDELWDEFVDGQRPLRDYLFLEPHSQLPRQWEIKGEDATFKTKLDGSISRFGAVSVLDYESFAEAATDHGYAPIFMEDPSEAFAWRESLTGDPGVSVPATLEGRLDRNGNPLKTINGFLAFQVAGINQMKTCERAFIPVWSTGTGKTLLAEAAIMWKRDHDYGANKDEGYDLCLYFNKPANLVNARRKLKDHTGLDSRILDGTPKRRERLFAETAAKMVEGEQPIVVLTAEKLREDLEYLKLLVEGKRVLVIIDEIPTKFGNRSTALYRAAAEVFYTSFVVSSQGKSKGKKIFYPNVDHDRPAEVFYVGMSATPIRNSPEDFFNSVRMLDSRIYGSITNFNNLFVAERDRWDNVVEWKNLDLFGAMAAHIVHIADKEKDPEIAAQFPEKLPEETFWCDLDKNAGHLYDTLANEYEALTAQEASLLDFDEILAAITVLGMLCFNPRSVLMSAKNYEAYLDARHAFEQTNPSDDELADFDKKNRDGSEVALKLRQIVNDDAKFIDTDKKGECVASKLVALRELIDAHDDKVIVFTSLNEMGQPIISEWLTKWGISHVCMSGTMTPKQKQTAQDSFRTDPEVKVFLSTDAGQDSIDLPEASLTIHTDLPWTWAGKKQRENRMDRIDSAKESVRTITLSVPGTVEDRKAEIVARKKGFHDQVFGGEIAEQAEKIKKSDFLYILTGRE